MAVPGSIYSELSIGTNNLLKDHVDVVNEPQDIYRCLGLEIPNIGEQKTAKQKQIFQKARETAGEDGEKIIKSLILLNKIANTDEIVKKSQLDTPRVHSTLTILELSEIIRRNSKGQYLLA